MKNLKQFKSIQNQFNKQTKAVSGQVKKTINVVKTITNTPQLINKLANGNDQLPYQFREKIAEIGNIQITSLQIIRNPVSSAIIEMMNIVSGFELKDKIKKSPYDNLFHLKIRINNKWDFEKESVPLLRDKINNKDQEILQISEIPGNIIRDFVENVVNLMGLNKFNTYNSKSNNCQNFALAILQANGINNENYNNFIKQDTEFIFKNSKNPVFTKILNTVTDIGNRAVILKDGEGIPKPLQNKTTLTNYDLANICIDSKIHLNMICMKDEMNLNNLENGNYIMNLENHDQDGSHWTAFVKKGKNIYYCDSFGMPPPQNQINLFNADKSKLQYSQTKIQDIKSKCCGFFCVAFLIFLNQGSGTMLQRCNKFIAQFDLKNAKKNNKIVKAIIKTPIKYLKK
jgi:hypothetical protein